MRTAVFITPDDHPSATTIEGAAYTVNMGGGGIHFDSAEDRARWLSEAAAACGLTLFGPSPTNADNPFG